MSGKSWMQSTSAWINWKIGNKIVNWIWAWKRRWRTKVKTHRTVHCPSNMICPTCGKKVREHYEAEVFVEKIKQNSAGQRNYEKKAGLKTGMVVTIEDVLRIVKQIQQKLNKK